METHAPKGSGVDWSKMMGESPQSKPDNGSDVLALARTVGLAGFRHEKPKAGPNSDSSHDVLATARKLGLVGLDDKEKPA